MAQCAQCLFENPDDSSACEQCGAELSVEVLSLQLGAVCSHCDSYNDPGVVVCVSCGEPLGADAAPLATQATALPVEEIAASLDDELPTPVAAPVQPWMAPPDTGEFAGVDKASVEKAGDQLTPLPSPPPFSVHEVTASPIPPRISGLPPGALPPGWAASPPKPSAAAARAEADSASCPRCQGPNPPSARYCGRCGFGLTPNAAKARGKLILIRGISGEGRQFPLSSAGATAGRTGTIAFPEDPYVGNQHATFLFRGNDLVVKDEGAGNGIYVRLREAQSLRPGDMFSIGEHLLRYSGVSVAPPNPASRHGSPRTSDRLQVLEEILEGGGIGRVCKRSGPVITIGRAGCDLNFPHDGFISARHAELSVAGETLFLRDLGSANGIFLRVQPRSDRVLQHGDYLLLGRELLRVEVSAAR